MEAIESTEIFIYIPAIFYFLVHLFLFYGIRRLKPGISKDKPFVSVIVAARNEEKTIDELIKSLLNQTYKNYEIIIVNDRSTDNTRKIITEFQKNHAEIKLIDINTLSNDMPAKKNALRTGIDASKGEIICFTDADCFPPVKWIEELILHFEPGVGLVAGFSPYLLPSNQNTKINIFKKLLFYFIEYEEIRAATWSSGSIGLGLGWLCVGRNLSYRKSVYNELNGFEKIKMSISGDDDLFLQLVRRKTKWKINYVLNESNFVPTLPPQNFSFFVEQRKRHFSAAKYFTFPMKCFFFFYHLANLLLLISPVFYFINYISIYVMAALLISKIISDLILYIPMHQIFKCNLHPLKFFLMETLYVFYNSIIGLLGLFGKFEWKQKK